MVCTDLFTPKITLFIFLTDALFVKSTQKRKLVYVDNQNALDGAEINDKVLCCESRCSMNLFSLFSCAIFVLTILTKWLVKT